MMKKDLLDVENVNVKSILTAVEEEKIIYVVIEKSYLESFSKVDFDEIIITNEEVENGYEEYLKSAKVIIIYKNNDEERLIATKIKEKLINYSYAIKMSLISNSEEIDINKFKQGICNGQWEYARWIIRDESSNGKIKEKIIEGILHYSIKKTLNYKVISDDEKKEKQIYIYRNGVYKEISYDILKSHVKKYIPIHLLTDKILRSVTNLLVSDEIKSRSIFMEDTHIINVVNGLYNVETGKLEKHSPEYIYENQLNVRFEENPINNGYWDNYINTLTMGDIELKNVLQELVGLILSNYNGALPKKMFILNGKKDTGKSKILTVLTEILGKRRNETIALQRLGDKFVLGNIRGKRLISSGEISTETIGIDAIEIIKMLTGRDEVPIEQKFYQKSNVDYEGVLFYCGNNLPNMKNAKVDIILDRIMIIPCNNEPIPLYEQDPNIINKLLKDKEYIFKWGLLGLNRLIKNNFKFSYSERIEVAISKYKKEIDSVGYFIERNFMITGERKDKIKTSELYNFYVKWCSQNLYYLHNKMDFKTRICDMGIMYNSKYQGNPYYEGLILKKDENN